MVNREQLEILKQGIDVWRKWRDENPFVIPNLAHADLRGAQLQGADLTSAHLGDADLTGANLTGALLSRADLRDANLKDALAFGADLMLTDLSGAILTRTTLRSTVFVKVDLTGAHLTNTNFAGARIGRVAFNDVDLSTAEGLDSVTHVFPSTIGIDTLVRSRGNISQGFLRGCGVPDRFIEFARSLVSNPIEYYSCFVSYSSKNQDFVELLYADLEARGVRCWIAPVDMKIGDKILDSIDHAIRLRDKLLLILSSDSVRSEWVEDEVSTAFEEERKRGQLVLFPVRIDDAVMDTGEAWAAKLRHRHIGNFSAWKDDRAYQKALDRLLRDLKQESA